MTAKKKNINDADFFDDDNLDALSEPVDLMDPDGEDDGDDVEDDAPVSDEDADSDAEDGEPVEDAETGEDDPAPHLTDPDQIKLAYAEIRKLANQTARENQELRTQLEQAQAIPEYDYEEEPVYDAQAFTHMAGQDPQAALRYALQGGRHADAQAAIAQVHADSAELAAMAAHAQRDNDPNAHQQYRMQATNAAAMAQAMQGEYNQALYAAQQAPLVADQNRRNVEQAWNLLNQQTNGDLSARGAQVRQVLSERPYLVQGADLGAIQRGYADAYDIARSMPEPAGTPKSIDSVVKEAVERQLAETRAAKAKAADAAAGTAGGRAAPGSGSASDSSLKNEIYETQKQASLGARNFMSL